MKCDELAIFASHQEEKAGQWVICPAKRNSALRSFVRLVTMGGENISPMFAP
jgi:hypothetical protein